MTQPNEPQERTYREPVVEPEALEPSTSSITAEAPADSTALGTPPTTVTSEPAEESEQGGGGGGKVKAAALLAGAAALANKVRQETPKKVQDIRQKRAAGRCVILVERPGRLLAIGPYANEEAARQDSLKLSGDVRVTELITQQAYFESQGEGSGSAL